MLNACRLIYRRAITATRVKGVPPATRRTLALPFRETRNNRLEKKRKIHTHTHNIYIYIYIRVRIFRRSSEIVRGDPIQGRACRYVRVEKGPSADRRRQMAEGGLTPRRSIATTPSNFPIGATPISPSLLNDTHTMHHSYFIPPSRRDNPIPSRAVASRAENSKAPKIERNDEGAGRRPSLHPRRAFSKRLTNSPIQHRVRIIERLFCLNFRETIATSSEQV